MRSLLLSCAFCALAACASAVPPVPANNLAEPGHEWVPGKTETKAWRSLLFSTESKQVEADRLVVEAWGSPGAGADKIEMRILARAAAEALELGYKHFAIVHVSDRNLPMSGGLGPAPVLGAEPVWIGDYESLVYNRYERDHAAAPKGWLIPGLRAVVVLVPESDRRAARSFDASEVFEFLGRKPL